MAPPPQIHNTPSPARWRTVNILCWHDSTTLHITTGQIQSTCLDKGQAITAYTLNTFLAGPNGLSSHKGDRPHRWTHTECQWYLPHSVNICSHDVYTTACYGISTTQSNSHSLSLCNLHRAHATLVQTLRLSAHHDSQQVEMVFFLS